MKKSIKILGINSSGFNTSASLIIDGKVLFAVEEERLIREKRTRKFPTQSINLILNKFKLKLTDIDYVAVGWNPAINLEAGNNAHNQGQARFLGEIFYNVANPLINLTSGDSEFSEQIIHFKKNKIHIFFIKHHFAHSAAFFLSKFKKSSILSIDAFGEKECCHYGVGESGKIRKLYSQEFPHSLGSFYSSFTSFLGFKAQSDEWKLMGASAYGKSLNYAKKLKKIIYPVKEGFELDLSFFNHFQFHRPGLFTKKLEEFLGIKANLFGKPLSQEYYDLAASVQCIFEEIIFHLLQNLYNKTKIPNLVFSGGCALNCLLNGKITRNSNFDHIFVPPFPDDSGVGIGAALYLYHNILNKKKRFTLEHNYLGPSYENKTIENFLKSYKISFKKLNDKYDVASESLKNGKIIGWFQGGLEFGDRSLGNRSILADPRDPKMKDKVNKLIKYREHFRPFAPAILKEFQAEFFHYSEDTQYMERVFIVKENKRHFIPSVTHNDGTARLQTVKMKNNLSFYKLINSFYKKTGIPILLNTSFNLRGEPMVCSPNDAIKTFHNSGLDELYLGDYLIHK